jgi:hypothetical protein
MSSTGAYTAAGRTFEIREWREGEDYRAAAFEDGTKVTAPATLTPGEAENLEMQGHSNPMTVLHRSVVSAIAGLTGVKTSEVRPIELPSKAPKETP